MAASSFSQLPEVDSELFEQVSDDEFALLEYYRALRPGQRAALLEALVRMVEPVWQAEKHWPSGRKSAGAAELR
jgi:hypothetical protein